MSSKKDVGNLGESLVARFLKKRGFNIVERNYLRKWGEIDIITEKEGKLHFVEVKSVSIKNNFRNELNSYRGEDNIHYFKQRRLRRAIESFLMEDGGQYGEEWFFDVVVVYINEKESRAKIKLLEDVPI